MRAYAGALMHTLLLPGQVTTGSGFTVMVKEQLLVQPFPLV